MNRQAALELLHNATGVQSLIEAADQLGLNPTEEDQELSLRELRSYILDRLGGISPEPLHQTSSIQAHYDDPDSLPQCSICQDPSLLLEDDFELIEHLLEDHNLEGDALAEALLASGVHPDDLEALIDEFADYSADDSSR